MNKNKEKIFTSVLITSKIKHKKNISEISKKTYQKLLANSAWNSALLLNP